MTRKTDDHKKQKTLVLASGNPDKVREMEQLLAVTGYTVCSLHEIAGKVDIEETGLTLEENAEIKARFVYEKTGLPALADDTGLEVDALGGRPGVWSARYGGPSGDAASNRRKLLKELSGVTEASDRSARFRTVLIYMTEEGVRRYDGVCQGRILDHERGSGGFGYDPLFLPDGYEQTFAEMEPELKNHISHRGRALRKFLEDMSSPDDRPV